MEINYDLAVIGGGPAGYNAAEKAASNGLKTILFEKAEIGGVCLNVGCIPTKTLLYTAKLYDSMKSASKYGLDVQNPGFDYSKIISRKTKIVKQLTSGVKAKLTTSGVTVINAHASIVSENQGTIHLKTNDEQYTATYVLLCTGSETIIPPITGLGSVDYWTSREALENHELPKSLAIIGGGVIGMEFASFFNSMGVQVHVIEMMHEILGSMDKESSAMLRSDYTKRGIKFHLGTKVMEVTPTEVLVEKEGKSNRIVADKILVSVGRKANTENIGLENLNLELHSRGVKVNEYMQTSHPHIYGCGDITGHSLLAHTAIIEGEVAINHILGSKEPMSYKAIPAVVYTNPEIAGVGKTEEELSAEGKYFKVLKLPMAYSGRFVSENEHGYGICKLIIDQNEQIIGCHLLGNPASELIVIAGMAVEKGYTVEEFKKTVFPHPTVGEIFHECLNL